MSTIVKLARPFKFINATVSQISVREPNFDDLMQLGEPFTIASRDGVQLITESPDTIRQYIERCADIDLNALTLLGLADSIALKDAVIGFFTAARKGIERTSSANSDGMPESSSSGSASISAPSTI